MEITIFRSNSLQFGSDSLMDLDKREILWNKVFPDRKEKVTNLKYGDSGYRKAVSLDVHNLRFEDALVLVC